MRHGSRIAGVLALALAFVVIAVPASAQAPRPELSLKSDSHDKVLARKALVVGVRTGSSATVRVKATVTVYAGGSRWFTVGPERATVGSGGGADTVRLRLGARNRKLIAFARSECASTKVLVTGIATRRGDNRTKRIDTALRRPRGC